MPLALKCNPGESWRDAAIRQAKKYGMDIEVALFYDAGIRAGSTEEDAAIDACYEWDCLDFGKEQ